MDAELTSSGPSSHDRSGLELSEISNATVRLYKEHFGRGPTKAATPYAGPDCIISTLENSLTPAERNLAVMGEHQRLRDVRLFFQHATEDQFRRSSTWSRPARRSVQSGRPGMRSAVRSTRPAVP